MSKIKLLFMGDYVCSTGFGTVSRNIIDNLYATDEYDIDVLGINYNGDPYDHEEWKGNVYPAMPGGMMRAPYNDVYGRQRLIDLMATNNYDVVMMLQDTFVIKDVAQALQDAREHTKTALVLYYPVDSTLDETWIKGVVDVMDIPVVYTQFGRQETLAISPEIHKKLAVIYHGTNTEDFNYVENRQKVIDFRHKYFSGAADNRFLIMNVARNQIRKDILHSLLTIKELRQTHPQALLYLHMAESDQGGSITTYAAQLGLKPGVDYIVPAAFNKGAPLKDMNMLYNAADAVLMTAHGEGWGLPMTEAFATKTPVVAANNTSMTEIGADNRAILVDCTNYTTYSVADNCRVRPVVDYHVAAQALGGLMDGTLTSDIEGAYKWATTFSWRLVSKDWDRILHKAAQITSVRRAREEKPTLLSPMEVAHTSSPSHKLKRKQERQNKKKARR